MKYQNSQGQGHRRSGFSRFEIVLLGGAGALCCAVLWPALAQVAPDNAVAGAGKPLTDDQMSAQCVDNLKQIGLAVLQYTQDYDEQMPMVAVRSPQTNDEDMAPVGWADAVLPYCKNTSLFQCPAEKHPSSITRVKGRTISDAAQLSGYTDYWYNENLTQIQQANIEKPERTLLFGEGDGGAINSNARYAMGSLPTRWLKNPRSPLYRHRNKTVAAYCLADGRVKFLTPDKISNKPPAQTAEDEATFEEGVPQVGLPTPGEPMLPQGVFR